MFLSKRLKLKDIVTIRQNLARLLSNPHDFSTPQKTCQPVEMSHSASNVIIPLADPSNQLRYLRADGGVRLGKLLEDLDTFAVHISYKHNDSLKDEENNTTPLGIVTALVDNVVIHQPNIPMDKDLRLKGQVSWVGSSSMEISMSVLDHKTDMNYIDALFVMVARSPETNRAAHVNALERTTAEDRKNYALGELNKRRRIADSKQDLFKSPPSNFESELIHGNFLKTLDPNAGTFSSRVLEENSVWMETCKLKSVLVAMPEHRNIHGKLFGGHIMRKAFELAYSNIKIVTGTSVECVGIDDISFRAPVNIGSLFLLNSQIAYSQDNFAVARLYAMVTDPIKKTNQTTNTFYFIFKTKDGSDMPKVVPRTYGESLLHVDAQRRFEYMYETLKE